VTTEKGISFLQLEKKIGMRIPVASQNTNRIFAHHL